MDKLTLMNFDISAGQYKEYVENILSAAKANRNHYTCVANVHMFVEAYKSEEFLNVVRSADLITPDGKPLSWAMKLLNGIQQERVAGMDLLPNLLRSSEQEKLTVYFYGGTNELLLKTHEFVKQHYPNLQVAGSYSPPFRPLTLDEQNEVVLNINNSGANLVFVVLGCPKQERWMHSVSSKINAALVGVGGALPVVVGMQKRAPIWMQQIGMEWFFRLLQEPQRLFKRYAVTNTLFIYLLLKEYIRLKLTKVAL